MGTCLLRDFPFDLARLRRRAVYRHYTSAPPLRLSVDLTDKGLGRMGIARPQQDAHHVLLGFVIKGDPDGLGQITPAVVMGIVEGKGLLAIVGGIEVNGNPLWFPLAVVLVPLETIGDLQRHLLGYALDSSSH